MEEKQKKGGRRQTNGRREAEEIGRVRKGVNKRAIRETGETTHTTHTHTDTHNSLGAKPSKLSANKELQQCLATVQLPCRKCKDGMIE